MTARRLVTVAVFDLPPMAHMARESLDAAGIKAVVADDQMVGMDWLLSTAVGGVKVQVWEEDAERAVTVLEESAADRVDESAVEDHEADEEGWDIDPSVEPPEADFAASSEPETPAALVTPSYAVESRDRVARRAFFVGWLGLPLLPLSAYAFYLCLNATFGQGPITDRGRFELAIAWATSLLSFCLANLLCFYSF